MMLWQPLKMTRAKPREFSIGAQAYSGNPRQSMSETKYEIRHETHAWYNLDSRSEFISYNMRSKLLRHIRALCHRPSRVYGTFSWKVLSLVG